MAIAQDMEALPGNLDGLTRHLPGFFYQLAMTPDGKFTYLHASAGVERMFGYAADAVEADAGLLLNSIHPDDYERVIAESLAHAETMEPWVSRFRVSRADGTQLWVEARDQPHRLPDGTIVWTGYANDITHQMLLQSALTDSEMKFRAMVENANDIIYTLSIDGTITYASPNWTEILGHPLHEVIGSNFEQFVHPDDVAACREFLDAVVQNGRKQGGIEYRVRHKNGQWRWHTANASPLTDRDGHVDSFAGIARDISERKVMEEQILHLAHHDALTDLPNRGHFLNLVDQALALARRKKSSIALMFVDLDGFKPVNDRLGHAAGDRVLQEVAKRLNGCLRGSDAAARLGGDEFMVLLTEVNDADGAMLVADRLRERVLEPVMVGDDEARVSCSIGVSLFPDHGNDATTLERQADLAMYEAKARGRNRVCLYHEGLSRD